MDKKCANCQHLYVGQLFIVCNKIRQKPIITKSGIYKFNNCPSFERLKEKDFTGIPDSLWKVGPIQVKSIKKRIRDLTLDEFINLCKEQNHQCDNCPAYHKESKSCGSKWTLLVYKRTCCYHFFKERMVEHHLHA